jgi:pimeloyl-ACP methyl ester carboxylesterase
VLLHGGLSGIGTSFGKLLPSLARSRQVVATELQAHGRTADIDRPLRMESLADDVAALLRHIDNADFFGYSVGAGVAQELAVQHPELVRKLVLASTSYDRSGIHPGILEGVAQLTPDALAGTPFEQEYARTAPIPGNWPSLIAKMGEMDGSLSDWPPERVRSITAPTLLIIGDSDIVGLPKPQLAVLPGTTHITVVDQADLLLSMIPAFLDAPMPKD